MADETNPVVPAPLAAALEAAAPKVEAVVPAAETEVKSLIERAEDTVKTLVAEVKDEVKTLVPEVEAAAKAAELKIVKFATAVRVDITDAEKVVATKLENEFLKAEVEINRLKKIQENVSKQFPQFVESLVKKYAVNPVTHVFDNVELAFKKKQ